MNSPGGPLLLDNDFRDPDSGAFPGDMAYRMRATCTHELVHVGQDPYFNTFTSTAARWWIEATAEYIANRFVASRGQALTGVDYYVDGTPKLLATPWDKSEGLASYAWARFLDWLATAKGVDTVALVKAVNGRGASLQNIDSALRSAGHEGLSPYFEDFAKAFHHENLWTGAFCDPSIVQADVRQFESFGHLAAMPRNASAVRLIVYREHTFAQRHLSATHVLFQGGPFPADARAKLVIHLPGVERDGGRHFAFAAGLGEFNLPLTGSPTPLAPVELAGGTGGVCWVSEQLGELTDAPGGVRQVSFLLGNHSVKQDAPGVTVRRWLLMPPRNVVYRRDPTTKDYEVTWQESVLAEQDKHDEFAGYNVYRRMPGDSDSPEEPLNPALLTTTNFTDTPPDGQDCVYTVTVVDTLGNESLAAEAQDRDPFQGTWSGKLLLVEGELVTPIQRWLDESSAELEETRAAELAAAQDAEERERIRTSHESARESDRKFEAAVIPAVEKIAAAVRLGVPIELEIALRDGKYFAKVTKVMLKRVDPDEDENPEIELVLRGERTIAPKGLPTELDMVMLPLHREDEINHVWRFELDTEQGTLAYGIRVDLKREPFERMGAELDR